MKFILKRRHAFFTGNYMPSTVIANIEYDAENAMLIIRFTSGDIYEYYKVPEDVYLSLKKSTTKGVYLNKHIKGKFAFTRVFREER